jgi:hypothetical protein
MPPITTISIDKLSRLVGTPHCTALIDAHTDLDYNSDLRLIPSSIRRPHAEGRQPHVLQRLCGDTSQLITFLRSR